MLDREDYYLVNDPDLCTSTLKYGIHFLKHNWSWMSGRPTIITVLHRYHLGSTFLPLSSFLFFLPLSLFSFFSFFSLSFSNYLPVLELVTLWQVPTIIHSITLTRSECLFVVFFLFLQFFSSSWLSIFDLFFSILILCLTFSNFFPVSPI